MGNMESLKVYDKQAEEQEAIPKQLQFQVEDRRKSALMTMIAPRSFTKENP